MPKLSSIIYRINSADEIVFVNDNWNLFASSNCGSNLLGENLLGRSLWDFISDRSTSELFHELLAAVRRGKNAAFKFRCDSPERRRHLEMQITNLAEGCVEFESSTVLIEPRPFQKLLDPEISRSENAVVMCSFCKKIDLDENRWAEVEDAVGGIFEKEAPPSLSHGICPECYLWFFTEFNIKSGDFFSSSRN